jgi:uncharacterized protein with HEPN domain
MKDDKVFLKHILDAIENIEEYLSGASYEDFSSNKMMVDAVVRELEIIGEASANITSGFQKEHPDVMWAKMKATRNFLIHEYFAVNTKIVWDTCKENLPELKQFVSGLLA